MAYDKDQQAAIDARLNVVVRAGAGAGKTSVLVGRYVRLVLEDRIPVDEILTLTFTRKAAAEMHERIYRALAEHAARKPGSDGGFVREQLERFESAVVSTLDSFCGSIARSGSTAFGIAPTFTVDEAKLGEFCDDLALRFLLSRGRGNASAPESGARVSSVRSLVRLNQFGPLWHDGFARLAKEHFLVSRELDLAGMMATQWEYLLSELARNASELEAIYEAIGALDGEVAKCIANGQMVTGSIDIGELTTGSFGAALRGTRGEQEDRQNAPLPGDVDRNVGELLSALDGLSAVKKTCGASKNPEVVEFKVQVDLLHASVARLRELLLTFRSWHELVGANELADEFQPIVLSGKRRSGILSYHDVTALAISVLASDLELRRYYKRRFKAIMIDEFQDNNDEQKKLLYLLAERMDREGPGVPAPSDLDPGKLFFVGDEKQSIYRFRGADVSVFKRLSNELGGPPALGAVGENRAAITLSNNYRSEPGLIRFFNAFFTRVFSDPEPAYEARFVPLGSRAPTPGLIPSVELWQLVGRDKDPELMEDNEAEAYHIARFIRESVDGGNLLVKAESPPAGNQATEVRPAGYGDIAILMRSTGNQMRVERMLRLMGIPYLAQTARSLFMEAPMNDLYNALQLVLYPQDRVALAAFLRSPLVGMTDDGIVRTLAEEGQPFSDVAGLSSADRERYDLAASRCVELAGLADTARLTDLIHHIWYRWGYRYHLLRREEYTAYLEHYDYIYELARLNEDRGLAAFLRMIRSNMGSNERMDELNIVRDEGDGVHIMTIHKAKGLEFPVVIVANTGNRGRSDSVSAAPFYRSDDHGLVFNVPASRSDSLRDKAVNFIYRVERDQAILQEYAELRRLLYVGATRAESHLIFSGFSRGNDRSLLTMLTPAFEAAAEELRDLPELSIAVRELEPVAITAWSGRQHQARTQEIAELAHKYSTAADSGQVMRRVYPRLAFTPTELNTAHSELELTAAVIPAAVGGQELVIDTAAASGLADLFGTFAHRCVEELGTGRSDSRALRNPAALPGSVRRQLKGKQLDDFLAEGVALAEGFLASDLWKLTEAAEAYEFELPFLLRLPLEMRGDPSDAAWVRGKMDFVLDRGDRVIVVDFKTDRVLSPEHYTVQMELYRRAARAIYDKPAESVLYHLRSGAVLTVDVEIDDDSLGRIVASLRLQGERT